jgi:Aspartyl protease
MKTRFIVVFVTAALVCASGTSVGADEKDLEVIPLQVTQLDHGRYRADMDVIIDGRKKQFELDSGARKTSVRSDQDIRQYPAAGKDLSGGNFGNLVEFEIIQPKKLEIGSHVFLNARLQRTDAGRKDSLLGIDILGQHPFQVDFKNSKLSILARLPGSLKVAPLRIQSGGHIALPMAMGKKKCYVLFDTGAEATLIDAQFVKANQQLFKLTRTDKGMDSTGKQRDTPIYEAISLQIGDLHLKNVEMAADEWNDTFRSKMEGLPIILGSNVIYHARWSFDTKKGVYAVEPL